MITDDWQLGRRTPNIQCVKWETMLDQPLVELCDRYDLPPAGAVSVVAAG